AVDGRGVARVLRAMGLGGVTVRRATTDDASLVYDWRTAPQVRDVSRHKEAIPRSEHDRWFARTLNDSSRVLLIGEHGGRPAGVVRFDIRDREAEVSIYMAPLLARRGLGPDLLDAGERWLTAHRQEVTVLNAEVLEANRASHGLFAAAGYTQ